MNDIEPKCIDLIVVDLPYGTTRIPFSPIAEKL